MSLLTLFQLNLDGTPTIPVSASDTLAVLVDASANTLIIDSIEVTDAVACAIADGTATVLIVDSVAVSDVVAVSSDDVVATPHVHALADDAVAVQSGEAALTDVTLHASDSCAVLLSTNVSTVVTGACAESIGIAATDTATVQDVTDQQDITVTDALTISTAESVSLYAELAALDTLVAELAESAVVPFVKTVQDDMTLAISDDSVVSTETPEDPVYWDGSLSLEYAGACPHSYQIPCRRNDSQRW